MLLGLKKTHHHEPLSIAGRTVQVWRAIVKILIISNLGWTYYSLTI